MTGPATTAAGGRSAGEVVWPWWSPGAVDQVQARIRGGDLGAVGLDTAIGGLEEALAAAVAPGATMMACSSGTLALSCAYLALGLPRGGEVLVSTGSFRATATALWPAGQIPILCDVDAATGGLDLDDAAVRVTPRTCAVVVTHQHGRLCAAGRLRAFADRHHLALVEDCSHAHGGALAGQMPGALADVAVWSLGTTKAVSGGQCGALATRDGAVAEAALAAIQPKHRVLAQVRGLGDAAALAHSGTGINGRAHPIAAILAADHLPGLGARLAIKAARLAAVAGAAARYLPELRFVPDVPGRTGGALYKAHARWHGRQPLPAVLAALQAAGARAARPAAPLHHLPAFTDPGLLSRVLPGAPQSASNGPAAAAAGPFPGAEEWGRGLLEFDTRDLYRAAQGGEPYAAVFARAAQLLASPHPT